MFSEGFDRSGHLRERYDLGATPEWMKNLGIIGDRFTLSFKNIKTHQGKDVDHNLTASEWHELPKALKSPFLVTTYGNADNKFSLYTSIKIGNKYVVAGIDVVRINKGKGVPILELNRIKTVFARDRYVMENGERILAWNENITPEQEALLRGHNFREYPTIQELYAAKVGNNSESSKFSDGKLETVIQELSLRHNREVYPEQPLSSAKVGNNSDNGKGIDTNSEEDNAGGEVRGYGLGVSEEKDVKGVRSLKLEEAEKELKRILSMKEAAEMPDAIESLEKFKEIFSKPVRSVLGKDIIVKDSVSKKIIRNNRSNLSGTIMATLEDADFVIRDTDGSLLYVKRYLSKGNENVYNIAVVNKSGEFEDYISSVHIKRDGNLLNKIKNGAELLLPDKRDGDGTKTRNNSAPGAKVGNNSESSKSEESIRYQILGEKGASALDAAEEATVRIGDYFRGRELSANERAVVDVYSGEADNKTVTVNRDGKEYKVVMRQGNENNAGAKHSIFRHYGTDSGVISEDDLLLIPEIIEKGEKEKKGAKITYKLSKNGTVYTVSTEQRDREERFTNFFSNRKGNVTRSYNTQLSAQAYSDIANSGAKVGNNSEKGKGIDTNSDEAKIARVMELGESLGKRVRIERSTPGDRGGIDAVNDKFNEDLQRQIEGELPKGYIYKLGIPGEILISCGFPNRPIELSSTNLQKHASMERHPFELSDISGLVNALQSPVAVFEYGDRLKSQNVIVEISKNGNNFLVGIHFNQTRDGVEVSSIRGIFPKNNSEWLNWISQGKALYLDKEKIQTLIDQQRKNLADVEYLDLDDVAKVVKNFENPKSDGRKNGGDVLDERKLYILYHKQKRQTTHVAWRLR
ncbi:MAG: hypothetical protein ACI30M_06610 [Muribaculaceae bacterium]